MLLVIILSIFILLALICTIKINFIIRVKGNKSSVNVEWYMLNKICLYKSNARNMETKHNKNYKKNNKNSKKNNKNNKKRNNIITKEKQKKILANVIKKRKYNVDQFKLKVDICSTDPIITSYLVALVGSFVGILIKLLNFNINYKNFHYKINPIYTNEKILNIKLKCIISANLVHIIFIIFTSILDWRSDENGRKSSNRKPYGNGNE